MMPYQHLRACYQAPDSLMLLSIYCYPKYCYLQDTLNSFLFPSIFSLYLSFSSSLYLLMLPPIYHFYCVPGTGTILINLLPSGYSLVKLSRQFGLIISSLGLLTASVSPFLSLATWEIHL
ncbi:hypothetical protein XENTR_v10014610 [Xenopus tropicalis]|nr:hypothetical protein XENTR_v10014610 [Xenopus tropicalis]